MSVGRLVFALDKYATLLEQAGFSKAAYEIDQISDALSKVAKIDEEELKGLARNRDVQKDVISFMYDQTNEHGHWQEMVRHLRGSSVHLPNEFQQNPRNMSMELAKIVVKQLTGAAPAGGYGGGTGTREISFD